MTAKSCGFCGSPEEGTHLDGCPQNYEGDEAHKARREFNVGYDHAHLVKEHRGPHSEHPSYLLAWTKVNDKFTDDEESRVAPGTPFSKSVPKGTSFDVVKERSLAMYGRPIHIAFAIEMVRGSDGKAIWNVKPVDAEFLEGAIDHVPSREGVILLQGHFK